jgi:hypothetical protein
MRGRLSLPIHQNVRPRVVLARRLHGLRKTSPTTTRQWQRASYNTGMYLCSSSNSCIYTHPHLAQPVRSKSSPPATLYYTAQKGRTLQLLFMTPDSHDSSCRKQDNDKQLPHPAEYTPPMTPYTGFTSEDLQFRDIVPPRSPTAPSKRSSCTFSEMSSDDNANSNDEKPRLERTDSEAWRYLRQFRSPTANAETTVRPGRPRYNRASTVQASFYTNTAPSLSHSHSSSISLSMPYTPSTRPLQPRTNPHTSSYGTRSADLVTPLTSTTAPSTPPQYSLKSAPLLATSKGNVEGEMMLYEKSPIPTVVSADGSLKQLFAASPR